MSKPFEKVDKALGEYYASQGRNDYFTNGIGIFLTFVQENGFEEAEINDELKAGSEDCMYLDFDDNFPYKDNVKDDEDSKAAELYEIIQNCYFKGSAYPPTTNTANSTKSVYDLNLSITKKDHKLALKKYKIECIKLLTNDGLEDDSLMKCFTISLINNRYPFLSFLVDVFNRDRILQKLNNKKSSLSVSAWVKQNKFLKSLRKKKNLHDLLKQGVESYGHRIAPKLNLSPIVRINDSPKAITAYLVMASNIINKILQKPVTVVPFQFDISIAVKDVLLGTQNSNDDHKNDDDDPFDDDEEDDDDDSDDEEDVDDGPIGDVIGDVKKKLSHEKCVNITATIDTHTDFVEKLNREIYTNFQTYLSQIDKMKKYGKTYPSKKRFCALIDRRDKKQNDSKKDKITFYEPPNNCNTIPDDHVAEWFMTSIRECIIPRIGYQQGKHDENVIGIGKKREEKARMQTIASNTSCFGQLLTFSYVVEAEDQIRCYLYWNAETLRIYPQDFWKIIPGLFKTDDLSLNDAKTLLPQINIQDRQFEKFYQEVTKRKDFPNINIS